MFIANRHLLHLFIAALACMAILSSCGAQPSGSPAASAPAAAEKPEERVKSFFRTFSQAINDPKISDAATKKEWADKLIAYTPPADQAGARAAIDKALGEFSGFDVGQMTGQPGVDVRMEVRFDVSETRLVEEKDNSAIVEVVSGTISMKPVGPDVEKLGADAEALSQEIPMGEFFKDASSGDSTIKLTRVDGVWYLVDALGKGA